ncbi:MAG TPA: lycopene cyclase domain-containing protein [Flavobacteriaceae bacterium]|nr:lycopene cyclase domain-containing protein [Flavobacteriaceae bacterium]HEX5743586.1 lycopene cyclase domain-containing protein [Flavobacteriaceae bacterium]
MKFSYLIINIITIIIPFLYSFHPKMNLIKWWKPIWLSLSTTAIFFLVWDVIFSAYGVWGFNPDYLIGFGFLGLPLEEWFFFWMIPYASLFIYFSLQYFKPNWKVNSTIIPVFSITLMTVSLLLIILNIDKLYTVVNFSVLFLILLYTYFRKKHLLGRFFIAYFIILIPFILVNGFLTGMFTVDPVVWYNPNEIAGLRMISIPIEDFGYTFSMLLMSLILIDQKIKISWDK